MWKLILRALDELVRKAESIVSPEPESIPSDRGQQGLRRLTVGRSACAISDVGQVRDHNEDCYMLSADERLLVVADGMGGHAAGDIAAAAAVEAVCAALPEERRRLLGPGLDGVEQALLAAFSAAHEKVATLAASDPARSGMGTTLIVGCVLNDTLYTCHAGDVRAYVKTAEGFRQMTEDHSMVGALLRAGQLTPEQVRHHPYRNEVLQAVGIGDSIHPDICQQLLSDGDLVLLCSDGLWDMLDEGEIAAIVIGEGSLRDRALRLMARASAEGGEDNITAILYEHHTASATSETRASDPATHPGSGAE